MSHLEYGDLVRLGMFFWLLPMLLKRVEVVFVLARLGSGGGVIEEEGYT